MTQTNCLSFHPGHHLNHEVVDSFNQPRILVDVSHVMDNAFLVTLNGVTEYWYHHKPQRLLDALTRSHPEGIEVTEDKRFLFVYTGQLIERFNMSQNKIEDCIWVKPENEMQQAIFAILKSIHANNVKKLIERGISA